jgi:signal transduction histidine kinase
MQTAERSPMTASAATEGRGTGVRAAARSYGIAVVAVAVTALIRQALEPIYGGTGIFVPFVLPVAIAAYAGGIGPGLLATFLSALMASFLISPPVGALRIESTAHVFTMLTFVVGGTVVAIAANGHRTGRRRAEHHARRAERLQAVAGALSGELTTAQTADAVLREGLHALGAGAGVIAMLQPDGTELEVVGAIGYGNDRIDPYRRFSVDADVPVSEAVRSRRPIVIHRTEEMRRRWPTLAASFQEGGSAVIVPLLDKSGPIGGLYFRFTSVQRFRTEDDAYLLALGRLCASALERARLHDGERRAARNAAFLARATARLGASLDIDDTIGLLAQVVVSEIADVCTVHVVEGERRIRLVATAAADDQLMGIVDRLAAIAPPDLDDEGGTGAIIRTGEHRLVERITPAMLEGAITDPAHLEVVLALDPTSYLAVPLKVRGETFGCVTMLTTATSGRRLDLVDLELARQLAEHAASATDNARLFSNLLAREGQQAAVARLGQLALEAPDTQELFDATVRELSSVLDVELTKILELLPGGEEVRLVAGVGWADGLVGNATVGTGMDSQAGYTLATHGPVVVDDLPSETRFHGPPLLREHGVISGMSVVIPGTNGPWGVLGIHTRRARAFSGDDANFLAAVANVLAGAIDRQRRLDDERRSQELGRAFIGVVSHELRTPITTIYGGAKLLSRLGPGDPSVISLAQDVEADAERLYRLTEDLLVMTRLERGDLRIADEPVLVSRMLERIAASEQRRWPEVRFDVDVTPGLGPAAGEDNYVEQIVRNLLGNAAKYSPAGTVVELQARAEDAEIAVRVLDRGPGIRHEEPERLFSLFYRSPSTAQQASGAGIGLFVCHQLVQAMGGRLWARQRDGGGAEFGFALRQYEDEDAGGAQMTDPSTARTSAG